MYEPLALCEDLCRELWLGQQASQALVLRRNSAEADELWVCADDMQALEASCWLTPVADNPYCSHPLPLQAAQQLERERRPAAAALAYEAAARVSLLPWPTQLVQCRWRDWPFCTAGLPRQWRLRGTSQSKGSPLQAERLSAACCETAQ